MYRVEPWPGTLPSQEHFQANITIITCLKYDDYSNCITFAGESVFQALIIITILNILDHAYRNFSIILIGGGGGGHSQFIKKKQRRRKQLSNVIGGIVMQQHCVTFAI